MRRSAVIILLAIVLIGLLAFAWFRSESEYQDKVRHGREMAAGLNAQFLADPRFRQVRALGYDKDSGPLWAEGSFRVTGTVFSSNDLMIVQSLVQSMNPSGKLECKINVVKPPQSVPSPQPIAKTPVQTNKPAPKTRPRKK